MFFSSWEIPAKSFELLVNKDGEKKCRQQKHGSKGIIVEKFKEYRGKKKLFRLVDVYVGEEN